MKKKMKKMNQPCKRDKYENSTGNSTDILVNSTGVLLDTARMFRIQHGCSGYSTDIPDTVRICRSTVLNKIQANEKRKMKKMNQPGSAISTETARTFGLQYGGTAVNSTGCRTGCSTGCSKETVRLFFGWYCSPPSGTQVQAPRSVDVAKII